MKIAVTSDPEIPVPPALYGGIERVIHLLVEQLTSRGHDVTLFAHRQSAVSCRLIPYEGTTSETAHHTLLNAWQIAHSNAKCRYDVVHSFGRLAYLAPLALLPRLPKLMSYQRPITESSIRSARRLFGRSIEFTACSRHVVGDLGRLAPFHVIYNAIQVANYTFRSAVAEDAPLVFLGRIEHIKGVHLAIDAARAAGRRLVIAGNVEAEHRDYFVNRVEPFVDGQNVTYVGPVDDRRKNDLLGGALALLMPILWEEPFGIVMIEALACGTPVIGLARGAVPEVVTNGKSGFIADDVEGLVQGIRNASTLSRHACRGAVEAHFSDSVIADQYERLYRGLATQRYS